MISPTLGGRAQTRESRFSELAQSSLLFLYWEEGLVLKAKDDLRKMGY